MALTLYVGVCLNILNFVQLPLFGKAGWTSKKHLHWFQIIFFKPHLKHECSPPLLETRANWKKLPNWYLIVKIWRPFNTKAAKRYKSPLARNIFAVCRILTFKALCSLWLLKSTTRKFFFLPGTTWAGVNIFNSGITVETIRYMAVRRSFVPAHLSILWRRGILIKLT